MGNSLSVSYDQDGRRAILLFRGEDRVWPFIRRICQDNSDQTEILARTSLSVPWWAFLACQKEIDYQSQRHRIDVIADPVAQSKLDQAQQHKEGYLAARDAEPVPEDTVLATLSKVGFIRELTTEQLRNVCRLASAPSGATFSVPGAGKTTEALAFYSVKRREETRLLVVAPKNAFAAWEEQLDACLIDSSQFVRLVGGYEAIKSILSRNPSKCLITYQQLPNVVGLISEYVGSHHCFVFLDESHRIKRGFEGVIGNAILSFSEVPAGKLIMSGTPMPNDVSDLVPQFRFLFPEITSDADNVRDLIAPIYVRTTKDELKLPPVTKTAIPVPLKPAQYELYELLRSEAARQAKRDLPIGDRMRLRKAGQSALRLLQVVSNPGLLAKVDFDHPDLLSEVLAEGDSPKLEYACLRARQLASEGRKCIIWSSFVSNVELIAKRLLDLGGDYIHGGVDAGSEFEDGTREQKIRRFLDDDGCMVLVANPAACGEGISLHTVCHNAIYLDRNYNAAQYLQSEDRIHRLGLAPGQATYVELLFSPGTVDESVERRLNAKIRNMAEVLEDPSLHVEPVLIDVDADIEAFDLEDMRDFLLHLSKRDG